MWTKQDARERRAIYFPNVRTHERTKMGGYLRLSDRKALSAIQR